MRHYLTGAIAVVVMASPLNAGAKYQLRLMPSASQTENWLDGVQFVDNSTPAAIVRVINVHDSLPDKQSTFRIALKNHSSLPLTIGPENVTIEVGESKRVAMLPFDELAGRFRRDMKRRQALAVFGNALSASSANGHDSGTFHASGMNSSGQISSVSGIYSGYNPALAAQQQAAVREQAQATAAALESRQLGGANALNGMLRKTTVAPGETIAGILAFDAPSDFKKLLKSGQVAIVIKIGHEEHRIAASLVKL